MNDKAHSIDRILREHIVARVVPGAVVGVLSKDFDRPLIVASGRLSADEGAPEVTTKTVYDVASITKVVPTSLLTLMYIDQGHLALEGLLKDYLPGYVGKYADQITLEHLLSYRVNWGLSMSSLRHKKPDEIFHTLYTTDPIEPPGTSTHYCNATAILLGLILERLAGVRLDHIAQSMLFDPLHMKHTGFSPTAFAEADMIAPTEKTKERGEVRGVVHDESAYVLQQAGLVPGSAGLFSTVGDLLQVVGCLLDNGMYDGRTIVGRGILERAMQPVDRALSPAMGLGWSVGPSEVVGHMPETAVHKTGFTGCLLYADAESELGVVILSNHTYPSRQVDAMLRNAFFRDILEVCAEA
jgi:CubicO group peptidase (beta-lactamase class C family)